MYGMQKNIKGKFTCPMILFQKNHRSILIVAALFNA